MSTSEVNDLTCCFCQKIYSTKFNVNKHKKICKKNPENNVEKNVEKKIKKRLKKTEKNELLHKQSEELLRKDEEIEFLKTLLLSFTNNSQKGETNINNTKNQIIVNNNNFSLSDIVSTLEPIDFSEIANSINSFTIKYIDEGNEGFAKFLCNHPCKEKFITTDHNRSVISYKTSENVVIKDPQAQMLLNRSLKENAEELLARLDQRKEYLNEKLDSSLSELDDIEIDKEQKKIDSINSLRNNIKKVLKNEIILNKPAVEVIKKNGLKNYQYIFQNSLKSLENDIISE